MKLPLPKWAMVVLIVVLAFVVIIAALALWSSTVPKLPPSPPTGAFIANNL